MYFCLIFITSSSKKNSKKRTLFSPITTSSKFLQNSKLIFPTFQTKFKLFGSILNKIISFRKRIDLYFCPLLCSS